MVASRGSSGCAGFARGKYRILFNGLQSADVRPTRLLDSRSFTERLSQVLQRGVWRTRVHPRFYTLVISQGPQGRIVRWDHGILKPCNEAARSGREAMVNFLQPPPHVETFHWRSNSIQDPQIDGSTAPGRDKRPHSGHSSGSGAFWGGIRLPEERQSGGISTAHYRSSSAAREQDLCAPVLTYPRARR